MEAKKMSFEGKLTNGSLCAKHNYFWIKISKGEIKDLEKLRRWIQ